MDECPIQTRIPINTNCLEDISLHMDNDRSGARHPVALNSAGLASGRTPLQHHTDNQPVPKEQMKAGCETGGKTLHKFKA